MPTLGPKVCKYHPLWAIQFPESNGAPGSQTGSPVSYSSTVWISLACLLSVYLSICRSICQSICLSIYLSIYLSSIKLSVYLPTYLSIYPSICLSVCPSVCPSCLREAHTQPRSTVNDVMSNLVDGAACGNPQAWMALVVASYCRNRMKTGAPGALNPEIQHDAPMEHPMMLRVVSNLVSFLRWHRESKMGILVEEMHVLEAPISVATPWFFPGLQCASHPGDNIHYNVHI